MSQTKIEKTKNQKLQNSNNWLKRFCLNLWKCLKFVLTFGHSYWFEKEKIRENEQKEQPSLVQNSPKIAEESDQLRQKVNPKVETDSFSRNLSSKISDSNKSPRVATNSQNFRIFNTPKEMAEATNIPIEFPKISMQKDKTFQGTFKYQKQEEYEQIMDRHIKNLQNPKYGEILKNWLLITKIPNVLTTDEFDSFLSGKLNKNKLSIVVNYLSKLKISTTPKELQRVFGSKDGQVIHDFTASIFGYIRLYNMKTSAGEISWTGAPNPNGTCYFNVAINQLLNQLGSEFELKGKPDKNLYPASYELYKLNELFGRGRVSIRKFDKIAKSLMKCLNKTLKEGGDPQEIIGALEEKISQEGFYDWRSSFFSLNPYITFQSEVQKYKNLLKNSDDITFSTPNSMSKNLIPFSENSPAVLHNVGRKNFFPLGFKIGDEVFEARAATILEGRKIININGHLYDIRKSKIIEIESDGKKIKEIPFDEFKKKAPEYLESHYEMREGKLLLVKKNKEILENYGNNPPHSMNYNSHVTYAFKTKFGHFLIDNGKIKAISPEEFTEKVHHSLTVTYSCPEKKMEQAPFGVIEKEKWAKAISQ